jgi:hypothetical protein
MMTSRLAISWRRLPATSPSSSAVRLNPCSPRPPRAALLGHDRQHSSVHNVGLPWVAKAGHQVLSVGSSFVTNEALCRPLNVPRLTAHLAVAKFNCRRVSHVDGSLELLAELSN